MSDEARAPASASQLAWLERRLSKARAASDWSIVAGHSPIRSVGEGHGDYPQVVMLCYGAPSTPVSAVFASRRPRVLGTPHLFIIYNT
jgi:hypothetical protein